MLSISIALNALSMHATCTAVFVAVAAIIGFGFSSLRTLGRISWLAWVGVTSIIVAGKPTSFLPRNWWHLTASSVLTVTIAVGLQDRPAAAPKDVPWKSDFKLVGSPAFAEAIAAISALVFSYTGTPAFFSIVAEMCEPNHYTRALILCQSVVTLVYVAVGAVVYYYCGFYVSSPALGSAGPSVKKVAYRLGLPGLIVSAAVLFHLPSMHVFVRIPRGSKHLTANTSTQWSTWIGCTFSVALVAYLVASGISVFNSLISLIGALLGTLICFQPMGCMWFYDSWTKGKQNPALKWYAMCVWAAFVVILGG
ncbi:transmembrane amino acid transporter [Colletotrichum salicis]|uniref:Transmembrane amino acid transporter n=1 Tax=Colletotrichum salicis TaxID=1209931 RepID=A0A135UM55_9PEZI|nr:transmembrane amino acid transporter [Colletotrichum salicis]